LLVSDWLAQIVLPKGMAKQVKRRLGLHVLTVSIYPSKKVHCGHLDQGGFHCRVSQGLPPLHQGWILSMI
jgi:hypothetical protein